MAAEQQAFGSVAAGRQAQGRSGVGHFPVGHGHGRLVGSDDGRLVGEGTGHGRLQMGFGQSEQGSGGGDGQGVEHAHCGLAPALVCRQPIPPVPQGQGIPGHAAPRRPRQQPGRGRREIIGHQALLQFLPQAGVEQT